MGTGAYVAQVLDLELPTAGFPLSVSRAYDSTRSIDGPMGYGWTSSLSAHLYYASYLLAAPDVVKREADITMPNGARYRFIENLDGSFNPPLGRHDTLSRNLDGSFDLTIQRSSSRLHFATDGTLAYLADEFGNQISLVYDVNGRLQRVQDSAGSGRFVDVYWGADGRLSGIQDSAGRQVSYTYDPGGMLTGVSDPLARISTYSYLAGKYVPLLATARDPWSRLLTQVTYDDQDRVVSYTENGEQHTYVFNYQGDPTTTAKVDSLGNTWVFTHGSGGLVTAGVAPGGLGSRTVTYYANGLVQEDTDETGIRTFYTYDPSGRPQSVTFDYQGPNAVRFDYTYDANFPNQLSGLTARNPVTGQFDSRWPGARYDYYSSADPAPGALKTAYRLRTDGVTLDVLRSYVYDSHGRLIRDLDAAGAGADYVYDAVGDLIEIQDPANNSAGLRPTTRFAYDAAGRMVSRTNPIGATTTYVHDAVGRPTTVTLSPPATPSTLPPFTTTFVYDTYDASTDLVVAVMTGPNGEQWQQAADAFGRVRRLVNRVGATTFFDYGHGRLEQISDAHGGTTAYVYDALGRLSATVFPDGLTENHTYYANGKKASTTDRRGNTTSYSYDSLKRLTAKHFADGTSITYSPLGRRPGTIYDTTVTPAETHTFGYDSSYRLAALTQAGRGTINYSYTAADLLESYSIVGGPTTSYTFNPDQSVRTISWSALAGQFEYSYDLTGEVVSLQYPGGSQQERTYDLRGRLTDLRFTDVLGDVIASYEYEYDQPSLETGASQLGLLTSTAMTAFRGYPGSEASQQFSYDADGRLVRADYSTSSTARQDRWTYDAVGNRASASSNGITETYGYAPGPNGSGSNRLIHAHGFDYQYDNNGNMTHGVSGWLLAWDQSNRLAVVTGTNTDLQFGYDAAGRRARRLVAGVATDMLFDGVDVVAAESPSGRQDFLYGPGLDEPLASVDGGLVRYQLPDLHGSLAILTDENGSVVSARRYDAWGAVLEQRGSETPLLGFTGRDEDAVNQLQYSRTRYYLPQLGRFASEDGLRNFQPVWGGDVYGYVRNAPTMYRDPFGLLPCRTVPGGGWSEIVDKRLELDWEFDSSTGPHYNALEWLGPGGRYGTRLTPGGAEPGIDLPTAFGLCKWAQWEIETGIKRHYQTYKIVCECPSVSYPGGLKKWDSPRGPIGSRRKTGLYKTVYIDYYHEECDFKENIPR